jgi:hypothetical protein
MIAFAFQVTKGTKYNVKWQEKYNNIGDTITMLLLLSYVWLPNKD